MLLLNNRTVTYQACIEICIKCAQACNKCFKSCLGKENINDMKEVLSILVDCAEICYVTAAYLCRDNIFSADLGRSCADLCDKCADMCEAFEDLDCKASVEVCRQCAEMCRRLQ